MHAWLAQKSVLEVSRPLTNSTGLPWPPGTSLHHWKSTTSNLSNCPNIHTLWSEVTKKFNSCFSSILPFGPWSEHPTPTQSPVLGMSSTFATTISFLHAVQTLEPWCVLCLCYCCWTISKTPTSNPCPLPNVQPNSGQHNSHELYQLILFLVWIVKKYIKESLCQVSA